MNYGFLRKADRELAHSYLGSWDRLEFPDLVIAPDGVPYLYRWYLVPKGSKANVYFHIQVASDPERPLHDHPWDNTSVILSGGYREVIAPNKTGQKSQEHERIAGDVIRRDAEWAHRLILPADIPYTMTIFTTGPKRREWGFWYPQGWVHEAQVCAKIGTTSYHKEVK